MCGIAGVAAPSPRRVDEARLKAMTDALAHRGPDGDGVWLSNDGTIGLGHRRLSIIDLSPAGAQPMHSGSGRFSLSFNGEIYNFPELRAELVEKGAHFRGHSDTEVILAGCEVWGFEQTLSRISGMFALAIWDHHERALHLVRDRIGIKPLYYEWAEGVLSFASELRPLAVYRGCVPAISPQGLTEFLRLGYVPGPLSIFQEVKKLPSGTYLTLHNGKLSGPKPYWTYAGAVEAGLADQISDANEAFEGLHRRLLKAVGSHMVSDVPLGAFLSGGTDSSTVVALMQAQSARPIKTFSIGFEDGKFNEAVYAAKVASHIGTDHTELFVTDRDAREVIPELPDIYDEPFADASQIPTFLVSKLARRDVTVALSGDGGDELFGGYNRYVFVAEFWERLRSFPSPLRATVAAVLASLKVSSWDRVFSGLAPVLPQRYRPALPGQKMHKIAAILPSRSLLEVHSRLVAHWATSELAVDPRWRGEGLHWLSLLQNFPELPAAAQQMVWDALTYLVDDILTKVDRATMRVGLEARVPLLDHEVIEFAWRIPMKMKIRNQTGKVLLREVLHRYVPKDLVERPKMGFSVPIDDWLRGALRAWAEDLLNRERLEREGYLDVDVIRTTWQNHLSGRVNCGTQLWTVLMFQHWLERTASWV